MSQVAGGINLVWPEKFSSVALNVGIGVSTEAQQRMKSVNAMNAVATLLRAGSGNQDKLSLSSTNSSNLAMGPV